MDTIGDLQRGRPAPPEPQAQLPLAVERVRRFDTPEFAGMTFHEVEAKSALNRVSGMPFAWSINPYRGCSHACSYCLAGDTPILLADGRTRRIADVRKGDEVYGTVRRGAHRRYEVTTVLDHWETRRLAHRIALADGTQLVASADHRFLTERGWRHVAPSPAAPQRPCLTTSSSLRGTGQFAVPPKEGPEYQLGYLCGVVRGHGDVDDVHPLRLALTDEVAVDRARSYLSRLGVETRLRTLTGASPTGGQGIATDSRAHMERIAALIEWPVRSTAGWDAGFLAGMFDAQGACSRGIVRFRTTDGALLERTARALERLGFDFRRESKVTGCRSIRLLGGLGERLRFLHLTDPAISRRGDMAGLALRRDADLRVVAVEPLGIEMPMYDISTGTGDFIANGLVSHNCFARPTHAYLNMSPVGDFERQVVVKTNVVEVLRRELAKPSWTGERVALGTNTDPYQRCEGRYRLMPGIIAALAESRTPFSILTKGTLITRDLAALTAAAEQVDVAAAFTIGMLDEALWSSSEPGTPSPRARLAAVRSLNEAGIPTGVMLAPIMPGLNDDPEQLSALIDAAVAAGATHVTPIVLHLRRGSRYPGGVGVRESFWPWLEQHHPHLVGWYAELYKGAQAPAAYRDEVTAFVHEAHRRARARHGAPPARPALSRGRDPSTPEDERTGNGQTAPTQLHLL